MFRPLLAIFPSARLAVASRFFSTESSRPLVIVEHSNKTITPGTFSTITAAKKLGPVTLLVAAGDDGDAIGKEAAKIEGVSKVLVAKNSAYSNPLAESLSALIASAQKKSNFSHLLFSSSSLGKNTAPRTAALLDVSPLTDVLAILSADKFQRPIYAGNAIATVTSKDSVKVMSIRSTAFEKATTGSSTAPIEDIEAVQDAKNLSHFEGVELTKSERPELTSARIVVAGGRAVKSKENFQLVEDLADSLHAAVGASRAAVDAGYAPNDYQVGQTGKIVAPELYVAIGISGAIQHLAGMKDSKVIVSINKDPEAPIFQVSDYGLVGDLFTVIPEMKKLIEAK